MRALVAASLVLLCPAATRAQAPVRLCMPQATPEIREELALELRARGHEVQGECPEPAGGWSLSLEVPDALADVWVQATAPDGETRRARVGGPLDTLDPRTVAVTAASLLVADPVPPPPQATSAPEPEPIVPPPPPPAPPAAFAAQSEPPPPAELVESSRSLQAQFMFEIGVFGGLISGEEGLFGVRLGFGLHFAPWLRARLPLWVSVLPGTVEIGTGFGLDGVIALSRGESWLELGLSARYGSRLRATNVMQGVGPGASVALFYAIGDAWRLFARADGMALFPIGAATDPEYGLYLFVGAAVFP